MGAAKHAASMSKDGTKVGAVLVGDDNGVLLTAFNGAPIGVNDAPDRYKRPEKYKWMSHSEQNLIAFAARNGISTNGKKVYVTHHPCSSCARTLIQAGICEIVVGNGKTNMPESEFEVAAIMFKEAGVKVTNENA